MKLAHLFEVRYRPLSNEWYVTSIIPGHKNKIGSFLHLEDAVKSAIDVVRQAIEVTDEFDDVDKVVQQIKAKPKGYWKNDKGEPIWEVGSDELSVLITRNRYGSMEDIWTQA